jgi:hypothetical protein
MPTAPQKPAIEFCSLDSSGRVLASTSNGAFQAARALSPEDLIAFRDNYKPGA